ncbi:MAPEG family protein [Litoribacillus peritrichatus]|uniref:MAPEG family protein n=1 Tax=Litoribacillus peritrichatus TaxID=718191 RepID=A0ABP7NF74_9GAMM
MYWFKLYVFFNVAFVTLLALYVSKVRITERVPHGDGGKINVKKAIRCHANGVEHVIAFGLVVLALAIESSSTLLPALVIGFTASRVIHAIGMFQVSALFRMSGATLTYLCEVVALTILGLELL